MRWEQRERQRPQLLHQPIKSEQLWNDSNGSSNTHAIIMANKADSNYSLKAFRLFFVHAFMQAKQNQERSSAKQNGGESARPTQTARVGNNEYGKNASEHRNGLVSRSSFFLLPRTQSTFNPLIASSPCVHHPY